MKQEFNPKDYKPQVMVELRCKNSGKKLRSYIMVPENFVIGHKVLEYMSNPLVVLDDDLGWRDPLNKHGCDEENSAVCWSAEDGHCHATLHFSIIPAEDIAEMDKLGCEILDELLAEEAGTSPTSVEGGG